MAVDVVVVGGGIMGASITYHLAKEGVNVVMVERGSIANTGGASRASAGGLRENDRDPRELPLAQNSLKRWKLLEDELDADLEFSPTGQLKLFDETKTNQINEAMKDNKYKKITSYLCGQEEIKEIFPHISSIYGQGIFYPSGGHADPLLTTLAFVNAAKRFGAKVRTGEEVTGLDVMDGQVKGLYTNTGLITSDWVINAAGAWSPQLHETLDMDFPLPITPRYPQMSATLPAPAMLGPVISVEGRRLSLKQTRDGRIRAGGGYESKPGSTKYSAAYSVESLSLQRKEVISVFPKANNYPVDFTYYGVEAECIDQVPIIGPIPGLEGYLLATGFSGHGFTLSPGIGQVMADLVQGRLPSISISGLTIDRILNNSISFEKEGREFPG